jgi:hypothetical protein
VPPCYPLNIFSPKALLARSLDDPALPRQWRQCGSTSHHADRSVDDLKLPRQHLNTVSSKALLARSLDDPALPRQWQQCGSTSHHRRPLRRRPQAAASASQHRQLQGPGRLAKVASQRSPRKGRLAKVASQRSRRVTGNRPYVWNLPEAPLLSTPSAPRP